MVITYKIGDGLYINMTNKCTNRCEFCIRNFSDHVGEEGVESLWLDREPTKEEVLEEIYKRDLTKFEELVFCGYGEPLMRVYDVLWVAKKVKEKHKIKIRVNTNGHANLVYKEDVTPLFEGLFDVVSISLNAKNAEEYDAICHSAFGEEAYYGMLSFAKKCKKHVPETILSVVDVMPPSDIEACRTIASEIGVGFRIRKNIEVS